MWWPWAPSPCSRIPLAAIITPVGGNQRSYQFKLYNFDFIELDISIGSGHCAGQAYQELLNGILARQQFKSGHYAEGEAAGDGVTGRHLNGLLYVMIGDPAMIAFEPMGIKEMTLRK